MRLLMHVRIVVSSTIQAHFHCPFVQPFKTDRDNCMMHSASLLGLLVLQQHTRRRLIFPFFNASRPTANLLLFSTLLAGSSRHSAPWRHARQGYIMIPISAVRLSLATLVLLDGRSRIVTVLDKSFGGWVTENLHH
jgi:hypothetical protein